MVGEVILTSESFEGRQARVSDPWQRENKETGEESLTDLAILPAVGSTFPWIRSLEQKEHNLF